MKAKIKATAMLRTGTGDLTYFGQFHRNEEVEIVENCNADSADIYNTVAGTCFLCRRKNGTMDYALATDLEITDYSPSIDWEQRRYELAKEAMQGLIGCCNYCKNNDMIWAERGDNLELVIQSISIADEMINQLKGGQG